MKKINLTVLFIVGCLQTEGLKKDSLSVQRPCLDESDLEAREFVVHKNQPTQKPFTPEKEIQNYFSNYRVDLNREATKFEIAAMGAIPLYVFCSKLGCPFCCLCI